MAIGSIGYTGPDKWDELMAAGDAAAKQAKEEYLGKMAAAGSEAERFGLGLRGNIVAGAMKPAAIASGVAEDVAGAVKGIGGFFSGITGGQPSAQAASGGQALTNAGTATLPVAPAASPAAPAATKTPLGQIQTPAASAPSGMQGAAAATFQGIQGGVPTFSNVKDGKVLTSEQLGITPASGQYNEEAARRYSSEIAALAAQADAFRAARLQDEAMQSGSPAVKAAALQMTGQIGELGQAARSAMLAAGAPKQGLGALDPKVMQEVQKQLLLEKMSPKAQAELAKTQVETERAKLGRIVMGTDPLTGAAMPMVQMPDGSLAPAKVSGSDQPSQSASFLAEIERRKAAAAK